MIVKSPERQGMRGPWPLMVSCGGVAISWPSAVEVEISGFDVVEGSVRSYVQSMFGEPGRGLSGATTMTRYWSPLSAGIGMVGGRAVLAAQVVTFDMSGSGAVNRCGADAAGRALMLRAASSRVASWRSGMTRPVPQGVGRADGRAVVMGCDEPLARGGGARHTIGAVWFGANRVCRRAFRDAQVCCWWAGGPRGCHGVVTSGAKHGGTEGDTLRRFLQVGGMGGTSWDG